MRLNGLGAPDDVTLVPLNKVEPAPTKTEPKQAENATQNTKKSTAFIAINLAISRLNAAKCGETNDNKQENIIAIPETPPGLPPNAIPVENPTKQKTVGTELTRQTTRDLNDISNKKENKIILHNSRQIKPQMNQKTRYAAPAFRGNRSREGVLINRSPHHLYKRLNSRV